MTPWTIYFGFPGLLPSVAFEMAGKVRELVSTQYPGVVTMGISVIGLAEHSHIHTRPWDHLADPELEEVLTARIKFQEYDYYLAQR